MADSEKANGGVTVDSQAEAGHIPCDQGNTDELRFVAAAGGSDTATNGSVHGAGASQSLHDDGLQSVVGVMEKEQEHRKGDQASESGEGSHQGITGVHGKGHGNSKIEEKVHVDGKGELPGYNAGAGEEGKELGHESVGLGRGEGSQSEAIKGNQGLGAESVESFAKENIGVKTGDNKTEAQFRRNEPVTEGDGIEEGNAEDEPRDDMTSGKNATDPSHEGQKKDETIDGKRSGDAAKCVNAKERDAGSHDEKSVHEQSHPSEVASGNQLPEVVQTISVDDGEGEQVKRHGASPRAASEFEDTANGDFPEKTSWMGPVIPTSGDALRKRSVVPADNLETSMDIAPSQIGPYITPAMTMLTDKLLFTALINNIKRLGKYLHFGTLATADDATLLIMLQNALFDVIKLCDAMSLLMQNYRASSKNIIEKMHVAYLYLLDGLPDFAKTDIECISKDVRSMQERSSKSLKVVYKLKGTLSLKISEDKCNLWKEVEDRAKNISEAICNNVDILAYDRNRDSNDDNRVNRNEDKVDDDQSEALSVSYQTGLSTFHVPVLEGSFELVSSMEVKEAQEEQRVSELPMTGNSAGSIQIIGDSPQPQQTAVIDSEVDRKVTIIEDRAGDTSKLQSYDNSIDSKEETNTSFVKRVKNLANRFRPAPIKGTIHDARQEASRPIPYPQVDAETVAECRHDREVYQRVMLLTSIIPASENILTNIEEILEDASRLVDTWNAEYKDIIEPWMAKEFGDAEGLTTEEQENYWKSSWFQQQARGYYSRWQALAAYSGQYYQKMKTLRRHLDALYTDNPYVREALKKAWEVAEEIAEDDASIDSTVTAWKREKDIFKHYCQ